MVPFDAASAMAPLLSEFERLGIAYYVGGSMASSLHGKPRLTLDVDIVADVRFNHVAPLVAALKAFYYIDAGMIQEAIRRRSCFNLIHGATSFKVDVFVLKDRQYDRAALQRAQRRPMPGATPSLSLPFASPEDTVLAKLEWYRLGDEVSEQQWRDLMTVLKVQGSRIDRAYMEKWAAELGVADLLARACHQLNIEGPL